MAWSRVVVTVPLLYQQLFYVPPPPVAAPAVDTINAAVCITNSQAGSRTLFYQAKVQLHAPPEVLTPPAVQAQSFSVVNSQAGRKTLFYQAKIEPVPVPTAVAVATIEWAQPLSRAPTRGPTETGLYTPFVPPIAPQVTASAWLQPFRRNVAGPFPVHTQPVLGYGAPAQVTPGQWLVPFGRAIPTPNYPLYTQPISGYQPEAVTLTTTLEWLQPFYKAVPPPKLNVTDVTYAEYAPVTSNLTTTLEWMVPWQGPPRVLRELAGGTVDSLQPSNLTTSLEWQIAWTGPPRYWPIKVQQTPFVPKEATLENTIPGSGWDLTTDGRQGPPRQLLGLPGGEPFIPKEAVLENTVPFGWQIAWQGAKPSKPIHTQPILPATPSNLTTTLEWQIAWQGPPRIWPLGKPYQPFVPREATIDNTLGHIAWLQPFYKAAPYPPVHQTQPVFGYPYEFASNLTTSIEWLQKWQGPPRLWPLGRPYQPFVPKEATLENTVTPDKWLQAFKGPPRYWPIKVQQTPFIPKEFVQDRVTPDKWLIGFQGSKPTKPIHTQPIVGYQPAAVVTLTTSIEWLQPFNAAVKTPPVRPSQASLIQTPPAAAATAQSFSITWTYPTRRTLFYQSWAYTYPAPPFVDNTITIDKWQQPLSSLVPRLTARTTQPFFGYPYEQAVPPAPIPPKHAHGEITSAGAETLVTVSGHGICYPAFQQDAFSAAFQTCEDLFLIPTGSRERVRTARSSTSSRWRKSRGRVRSSRSKTTARDDP